MNSARLTDGTLMNRRSYPYKLTSADYLVIRKWKWRLTIVYGSAILLALVAIALMSPGQNRTEEAGNHSARGLSSALVTTDRPAH
jgi:hypothetical protein